VGTVGKFNWVDLTTTDREAAKEFYTGLFGWTGDDQPAGESQVYTMFSKDGKQVAGGGEAPPEQPMPPAWTPYITVDDVDTTAGRVEGSGGVTLMPPLDVMDAGRMAIFSDPTGAPVAVWQDGNATGAELFDAPGSITWVELGTGDIATATKFYKDVFGWGSEVGPMGSGGEYTVFKLGEDNVAGAYDKTGVLPDEVPPHWLVYFAVDDIEATVSKAKDLGGNAIDIMEVADVGRFSVITDPQGAVFAAIEEPS
jgi:hypothetical protein